MGIYIGIDLGTTYSAVSYLDETGRPQITIIPQKQMEITSPHQMFAR